MAKEVMAELKRVPVRHPQQNLRYSYYQLLSHEERQKLPKALECYIGPLIERCAGVSPHTKCRLIYDALSRFLTYDMTQDAGELRYSYVGGLMNGRAVCMGIAELFTMLAKAFGLKCVTVIGYGGDPARKGGLHAWNIVWIEEISYHMDLTWDLQRRLFRFYLKSDAYMRDHDHQWLEERYPRCPVNGTHIPRVPKEAVDTMVHQLEALRKNLNN